MKRAELIVLIITLAFVCFTAGFFTGRGHTTAAISVSPVERETPSVSDISNAPSVSHGDKSEMADSELLDLNSATVDELSKLPGIGEVLAQRIVDYREEHGNFSAVSDIMNVNGIGEAKYLSAKDYLTVSGQG